MNVVFRVDASNQIGSGHVIRCLNLARSFRDSGSIVNFITRSHAGNLDNLIKSRNFKVHSIPVIYKTEPRNLNGYEKWLGVSQSNDAKDTIKKFYNIKPDLLVIDHYSLDIEWESILRPQVQSILVIDDLANRKHDCDWLLDQNFIANDKRYDSIVPSKTIKILGPKYAIVSEDFLSYRKNTDQHQDIKRVFIFFGGADPFNLTMLALKSLQHHKLKELELVVVIGASNIHIDEVESFVAKLDKAILYNQVENIAELMAGSDLAIGAGGSSTWERFVIGLPCIVITFGQDQETTIKELHKDNLTTWIGSVDQVNKDSLSKAIISVIKNPIKLHKKTLKAQKLVDGLGDKRILKIIKNTIKFTHFIPRRAINNDMKIYWKWVNEKDVRKNAFSESLIEWDEHQEWFKKSLCNKEIILLVLEKNSIPYGQVRFSKKDNKYEIDYSLSKEFRGKGLATPMLNAAIDYLKLSGPVIMYAEVKYSNVASQEVFKKLGFTKNKSKKDINKVTFELEIK